MVIPIKDRWIKVLQSELQKPLTTNLHELTHYEATWHPNNVDSVDLRAQIYSDLINGWHNKALFDNA